MSFKIKELYVSEQTLSIAITSIARSEIINYMETFMLK